MSRTEFRFPQIAVLIAALLGASAARAAISEQTEVPVDQTELTFARATDPDRETIFHDSRMQFQGSTWAPGGIQGFSYEGLSTPFSTSVPSLSLTYLFSPFALQPNGGGSGLLAGGWHDVSFRAGASLMSLSRSAALTMDSYQGETYSQTLNLFSLDLGAEWDPSALRYKSLSPYLGLSLLPTDAYTTRSAFDDSTSSFAMPVQARIGVNLQLPEFWIFSGRNRAAANAGVVATFGEISNSHPVSAGAQAGLTVAM